MNETVIKKVFAAVLALCAVQLFALTSADASASAAIADPADVKLKAATDKSNPIDYAEGETRRRSVRRLERGADGGLPVEF